MKNPLTPHKTKKHSPLLRLTILAILAAALYTAAFITAIHLTGRHDSAAPSDLIIVLGAGLRHDGRPGWALTRRSMQAAEQWKKGIAEAVLCTGGQAEYFPRSEADACREILLRQGLPHSAILIEDKSRSTEENALYSKQIMAQNGWTSATIVSDSYHILRASWLFQRRNIDVAASPVPAKRIHQPLFYVYSLFREFIAFHWVILKDALNLPVTHLRGL